MDDYKKERRKCFVFGIFWFHFLVCLFPTTSLQSTSDTTKRESTVLTLSQRVPFGKNRHQQKEKEKMIEEANEKMPMDEILLLYHMAFMVVGWGFFYSVGSVFARYLKHPPNSRSSPFLFSLLSWFSAVVDSKRFFASLVTDSVLVVPVPRCDPSWRHDLSAGWLCSGFPPRCRWR